MSNSYFGPPVEMWLSRLKNWSDDKWIESDYTELAEVMNTCASEDCLALWSASTNRIRVTLHIVDRVGKRVRDIIGGNDRVCTANSTCCK